MTLKLKANCVPHAPAFPHSCCADALRMSEAILRIVASFYSLEPRVMLAVIRLRPLVDGGVRIVRVMRAHACLRQRVLQACDRIDSAAFLRGLLPVRLQFADERAAVMRECRIDPRLQRAERVDLHD